MARYIRNKSGRRVAVQVPYGQYLTMRRQFTSLHAENMFLRNALDAAVPRAEHLADPVPHYQLN